MAIDRETIGLGVGLSLTIAFTVMAGIMSFNATARKLVQQKLNENSTIKIGPDQNASITSLNKKISRIETINVLLSESSAAEFLLDKKVRLQHDQDTNQSFLILRKTGSNTLTLPDDLSPETCASDTEILVKAVQKDSYGNDKLGTYTCGIDGTVSYEPAAQSQQDFIPEKPAAKPSI